MNKPEWYEKAGKEPFKRNHFSGRLEAGVKNRMGTEKRTHSRTGWYARAAIAVLGVIIAFSTFFSNGGSVNNPIPNQSPAANPSSESSSDQIRMIDKNNGWAFGTSVKRTINGGQTWVDRTPQGYDKTRYEPFLFNEQFAWFVVRPADNESNWTIHSTDDGGHSWNPATLPTKDTWTVSQLNTAFNLYFMDEKTGVFSFVSDPAAGPVTTAVYQTTNGGQTWKYVNKIVPDGVLVSTPSGMSFSDSMHGFMTFSNSRDSRPEIYRTTDGGTSWTRLTLDLPQDITDAMFFAEHPPQFFGSKKKEGVMSISYMTKNSERAGIVWFTTENGGASWTPVISQEGVPVALSQDGSAPQGFRLSAASDLDHFWMIDSEAGTLYGTSDGGGHWRVLNTSPQLRNAAKIKFIDHMIGWVRGDGFLLRTEDGGMSWKEFFVK